MCSVPCWAEWSEKEPEAIFLVLGVHVVEGMRGKIKGRGRTFIQGKINSKCLGLELDDGGVK